MYSTWEVIRWWEVRRIIFNLTLFVVGVASIIGMIVLMAQKIPKGEDAIEPLALIAGAFGYGTLANLFYTLGWIVELWLRQQDRENSRMVGHRLFILGLSLSCLLTSLPLWYGCLFWLIKK